MTKTLTKQWKDGELEDDVYYVKFYTTNPPHIMEVGTEYLETLSKFNGTDRAEVLAPVPSYEEWKRLQEQLKEAQHTIYCIANTDGSDCKTILETIIRDANLYLDKWGVK